MKMKTSKRNKIRTRTRIRAGHQAAPRRGEGKAGGRPSSSQGNRSSNRRERYGNGSWADGLTRRLRKQLKAGGGTNDLVKLRELAETNCVWASRYASMTLN